MENSDFNTFELLIMKDQITQALKTCYDPEIPVNIYELGLIYSVDVEKDGAVRIKMTLTSPACPAAQSLPPEVKQKVEAVKGVASVNVEVVWEPRWDPSMMSEEAKLALNMY
ncbi:MAG TPA: SUF system Fe-S cluster assembly protein [Bacteroidota bacterium]|nr:SUF system Fe-S cluster assembly protein [Bacteroidota bacterium]